MAKDKDLLTEGQMNRWAKLANIKSSLNSGMLTESVAPVKEEEAVNEDETVKEEEAVNEEETVNEKETVEENLEDLEDEDEMLDDLGDEAPEEDMPVDEGTVEELVSAIAGAIQDVTGVEVNVEGDAEEDLEGDDFEPAEDEDLGDDDELMEGDGGEVKYKGTKGGASHYEGPETVIEPQKVTRSKEGVYSPDKPTEITGRAKPTKEGLVQEQIEAVRNYIISEVANRVRARAQHEAQKQQLAESLADKIFAKLRNKKG